MVGIAGADEDRLLGGDGGVGWIGIGGMARDCGGGIGGAIAWLACAGCGTGMFFGVVGLGGMFGATCICIGCMGGMMSLLL